MEFQQGTFQKFKATTKVHLGSIQQDIMEGGVVEYDGSSLKIGGQAYNVPSVAGAIKLGWLVPVADNISRYIPQPAGVQVHAAKSASQGRGQAMTIEPAMDDEQEVGTLAHSNAKRDAALAGQNPAAGQQRPQVARPQAKQAAVEPTKKKYVVEHEDPPEEIEFDTSADDDGDFDVGMEADDSQNAGARPVARLGSATQKTILTDVGAASKAMNAAESGGLKVKKLAKISRTNEDAKGGTNINQKHASGATGDVNEMMSGDDLAAILPDAVSSGTPRAGVVRQGDDGDTRLAWDKSLQWRQRVKKAVEEYGHDNNAIKQILEVEDPAVVKFIKAGLGRK